MARMLLNLEYSGGGGECNSMPEIPAAARVFRAAKVVEFMKVTGVIELVDIFYLAAKVRIIFLTCKKNDKKLSG